MMPFSPSPRAWPPKPTPSLVASIHILPLRGLTPTPIIEQTSPPEQAGTTAGIPCASALVTTSVASKAGHRVNVAAGGTACINVPGGASTRNGRKLPSFAGVSGVVIALNTKPATPRVQPKGILIGPRVAGEEPLKSTTISVSVIVTVALIFTRVSLSMPSSSTQSSADQVPFGKAAKRVRA